MSFRVGDVCEVIDPLNEGIFPELGIDVCITGIRGYPAKTNGEAVYFVRGGWGCYEAHNLRLKRPPSTDDFTAGEWEQCPWQPKRVTA